MGLGFCAALYSANFFLQRESGGSRGSARHYIPRSPYRKALTEAGLSRKAVREAGTGHAAASTAALGASAASRTGARPAGRDAAAPGPLSRQREALKGTRGLSTFWRPPPRSRRNPSWPGGARGCQPPPRRYRTGGLLKVTHTKCVS